MLGLTSWGLIVLLLVILAAVLALVALRGWTRLGGTGPLAWAGRIGVLAGVQLVIVALVLTAVNKYYLFYGSWSDLLGAAGGDSRVVEKPPANPHAAATSQVTVVPAAQLGPGHGRTPAKDGLIQHLDIQGVRTGLKSEAYVYLPPQYFQKKDAAKRFPVVLFIAGYPAADRLTWIDKGHVPEEAFLQMSSGKAQPMIYVMMRPTVENGWDTECADVPGGPQVETFFSQDVPEAITETYKNRVARDRRGWGLAGYSTGGYCATKLAMLHPDRFSAASSMAGHFHALLDTTTRDLYGGSKAVRNSNNLTWRLKNLPQPPVSILVASALSGEKTFPSAQKFMEAVRPPLVVDKWMLPSGGHNFKAFRKYIPPTISWLSDHLQGE
ncbi:alpha/beta hydrolase [Actinomadura gamaensis]|uniref:Alpha/beta hydrolase n=1 Tax=Actinomadura gamaensis TaxID=1763541 RepID=A0ABV9U3A9_9ACTN